MRTSHPNPSRWLPIAGNKKSTAAGGGGTVATRAEGPPLTPKIPHTRKQDVGILRAHGNHGAAGGEIAAFQNLVPGFPAVGGLVQSAVIAVAPEFSRNTGVDRVAVLGVHDDFGNALGIGQTHVGPVVAAIRGFVNAIADGNAVAG